MAEKIGKNTQRFPIGHGLYPDGCIRVIEYWDDGSETVTETALKKPEAPKLEGKVIDGVFWPEGVE